MTKSFNRSELLEISVWVADDLRCGAERRIEIDRRAIELIDRLLNQDDAPTHLKLTWSAEIVLTVDRFCALADKEVMGTISNSLPVVDATASLKIARERLIARIAAIEAAAK